MVQAVSPRHCGYDVAAVDGHGSRRDDTQDVGGRGGSGYDDGGLTHLVDRVRGRGKPEQP
jgi:hypothetical protein